MKKLYVLAAALSSTLCAGTVLACSTAAWIGGVGGASGVTAAQPNDVDSSPRLSGFCGMKVSGEGWVQDNNPSDNRVLARFYFFPGNLGGSGDVPIFVAYSDDAATTELFRIRYNNGNVVFDATAAGAGTAPITALPGNWNSIAFDWNSTAGTLAYWLNKDPTTETEDGTVGSIPSSTMESVRLGLVEGLGSFGGFAVFDEYESRRLTAVEPKLICDANADATYSLSDILATISERYGSPPTLAPGQPDCDSDGDVDLSDILAVINVVFPPA